MKEERHSILKKIAEGELTVEEGQELLEQLDQQHGRDGWHYEYRGTISERELDRIKTKVRANVNQEFFDELEEIGSAQLTYRTIEQLVVKHVRNEYLVDMAKLGYSDIPDRDLALLIMTKSPLKKPFHPAAHFRHHGAHPES